MKMRRKKRWNREKNGISNDNDRHCWRFEEEIPAKPEAQWRSVNCLVV
jgi:hypothetical protein